MSRLVATFALCALATSAAASGPELVADMADGRVMVAKDATSAWHPASLTKLMTTYVALRAVSAGVVGLDTPVVVSAASLRAAPSRSGLRLGSSVTLADALKILMVKSANDVAVAVAETVAGGDVGRFVEAMNAWSASLGMVGSRWRNPHGLHDPEQVTTARDLAVLATALGRDFPSMASLFSISAVEVSGRVMSNHNGAVGRYPATDGMKTGFVCASGFNVVTTATRDGRRVIAVVLGQDSAMARDARATLMLEAAFRAGPARGGDTLSTLAPGAASPPSRSCGRRHPSEDEVDEATAGVMARWVGDFARIPRSLGPAQHVTVTAPSSATEARTAAVRTSSKGKASVSADALGVADPTSSVRTPEARTERRRF